MRHISQRRSFTALKNSTQCWQSSIRFNFHFCFCSKSIIQPVAEMNWRRDYNAFLGHGINNNVNTNLLIKLMGLHWGRRFVCCILTQCLYWTWTSNQNDFWDRNSIPSIDFSLSVRFSHAPLVMSLSSSCVLVWFRSTSRRSDFINLYLAWNLHYYSVVRNVRCSRLSSCIYDDAFVVAFWHSSSIESSERHLAITEPSQRIFTTYLE